MPASEEERSGEAEHRGDGLVSVLDRRMRCGPWRRSTRAGPSPPLVVLLGEIALWPMFRALAWKTDESARPAASRIGAAGGRTR